MLVGAGRAGALVEANWVGRSGVVVAMAAGFVTKIYYLFWKHPFTAILTAILIAILITGALCDF